MPEKPAVLLVDNGSLQPAATLALRRLAAAVSREVGRAVEPVSLLHSSAIEPGRLGGVAAEIFESAVRRRYALGVREFVVLPLFFGPSGALSGYMPARVEELRAGLPGLQVRVGPPLVDAVEGEGGRAVVAILAAQVQGVIEAQGLKRPWVVLVDHGSPQRAVGAVRDGLARGLAAKLGGAVEEVVAASMERREGAEYDFNEPLVARALEKVEARSGVVALLFFAPGRHAGPGGDIAGICAEAERRRPGLRCCLTPLVGEHEGLVAILARRLREMGG